MYNRYMYVETKSTNEKMFDHHSVIEISNAGDLELSDLVLQQLCIEHLEADVYTGTLVLQSASGNTFTVVQWCEGKKIDVLNVRFVFAEHRLMFVS